MVSVLAPANPKTPTTAPMPVSAHDLRRTPIIKGLNDSRLVQYAAELFAMEDDIIGLIDETRPTHPEASKQLTDVLGYLVAAHVALKDATDWPVPLR